MITKQEFKEKSKIVIDWIAQYFNQIEEFPVKSNVKPKAIYHQIPTEAPEQSETLEAIMEDLNQIILPGITHWQHPNFHAYFPANSSVESVFAEMITASIGAQCMLWETSPAAAELEEKMMEWLRDAMSLPKDFTAVIQDSASSASLVAILTAREVKTNFESNINGVPNHLRVYCSVQTHSSVEKAVRIAGIGSRNLQKIPVDENQRMICTDLEATIQADIEKGFVPCCVVAAIGTTGTVAIDDLKTIGEICRKYNVWLHVDAAYAGTALLLPEYRWMAEGVELADSFVFNAHKWMFTNFDCSIYFVKNEEALIRTFEILPEYLKTKTRGLVNDYRDWGIPLGRRFRALKLWFVIRSFGLNGLREKLRHHIQLNQTFTAWIDKDENFELTTKAFLNFCTFRFHPKGLDDEEKLNQLNQQLVERINQSGELYLTHTKLNAKYIIRFVIGQTYVEHKHIQKAWQLIQKTSRFIRT